MTQRLIAVFTALIILAGCKNGNKNENWERDYIVLKEQGSFAAGGTVLTAPGTYDPNGPTEKGHPLPPYFLSHSITHLE